MEELIKDFKNQILNVKTKPSSDDPLLKVALKYHAKHNPDITHEEYQQARRAISMLCGNFVQAMFAHKLGGTNLGVGDKTKCDIRTSKYIIEIKNKYNTCNSSSKRAVLENLAMAALNTSLKPVFAIWNGSGKSVEKAVEKVKVKGKNVKVEYLEGDLLCKTLLRVSQKQLLKEIITKFNKEPKVKAQTKTSKKTKEVTETLTIKTKKTKDVTKTPTKTPTKSKTKHNNNDHVQTESYSSSEWSEHVQAATFQRRSVRIAQLGLKGILRRSLRLASK